MPVKRLNNWVAPIAAGLTVAGACFTAGIYWVSFREELDAILALGEKLPQVEQKADKLEYQVDHMSKQMRALNDRFNAQEERIFD